MFKKVDPKVSFPKMEEEILRFWDAEKIFEKSVENRNGKPLYSFYDGPPFATGTPHYGHIVASTIKDTVPRYWTMKGHQVPRRWGWDTHGLPIENIAEKELGITHKKEILELGVAKFNEICRSKVLEYVDEWKKVIHRFGRWADMDNAYSTMDLSYMESVWWAFKELWDKGLIYESYRSMHICPRCETTLSQSEVAEGYKDVKDLAVTVKFKLNAGQKIGDFVTDESTFVLAWTTTPWTLPGNVALAVHEDIEYVVVRTINVQKMANTGTKVYENLIIAKDIFEEIEEADLRDPLRIAFNVCSADSLKEGETFTEGAKVVETFKGSELVRKSYEPLFSFLKEIIDSNKTPKSLKKQDSNESVAPQFAIKPDERFEEKSKEIDKDSREFWKFYDDEDATAYKIYHADFVTTEMGTGIAHEAPAFGEEDMELGKKENLPFVQHVKMDGTIEDEVTGFGGKSLSLKAKGKQDEVREVDLDVKKYLDEKGLLFSSEKYLHSYPHCWRCDTPLLNYATTSWFVKVTEVKERALELAKGIHWSPEHIKEGRFGKWLEGARDWSISRQRFWASVMPIWKCDKCTHLEVFGSVAELEKASGEKVTDLHKHVVDEISYKCEKCDGGTMKRIPDVLDTWFDSGSMPYAQNHYPFENKEKFEKSFPAQFIAEGIDQTRAWFYYLHVMGTSLKGSNAFQNVIVNGVVLAEDGKKMSKRLKN
ncbi:MAG: isoleucine--tRNA ligase, partial [bacterium]|nr:isoleucine--tRNA ligase [bacterium]